MIINNIINIRKEIASVCEASSRDPKDITLVGVTKYVELNKVKEAIEYGIEHIGENRVQDAREKFEELDSSGFEVIKHMIGHLQTNKVKSAVEIFDLIQSVDSLKLALEIDKCARAVNRRVDILIQINISGEEQKFGTDKEVGLELIDHILKLENVRVLGLMTMAPFTEDVAIIRNCFKGLRLFRNQINQKFQGNRNIEMRYLSMGMSSDFKIAIEEGANMIRIGGALFQ
ncbi:MAG: YggS family pyridoxal phosphate-dependent enzyme [Candidatus Zapsychrus exili]|nr:YggS family pyridoxal phosphate-dependent enzyme [Candidatus Zapsychrus exili]